MVLVTHPATAFRPVRSPALAVTSRQLSGWSVLALGIPPGDWVPPKKMLLSEQFGSFYAVLRAKMTRRGQFFSLRFWPALAGRGDSQRVPCGRGAGRIVEML